MPHSEMLPPPPLLSCNCSSEIQRVRRVQLSALPSNHPEAQRRLYAANIIAQMPVAA